MKRFILFLGLVCLLGYQIYVGYTGLWMWVTIGAAVVDLLAMLIPDEALDFLDGSSDMIGSSGYFDGDLFDGED